jgi:hypothetical protein
MATITLELPDELATQLNPAQLPALLREAIEARKAKATPATNGAETGQPHNQPLQQEVTDFLAASPTLEQLIAFKLSDAAQSRLEDLLDQNREASLTADEQAELDQYLQYRHLLIVLKAGARRVLSAQTESHTA